MAQLTLVAVVAVVQVLEAVRLEALVVQELLLFDT
jgi:hypothetical protein